MPWLLCGDFRPRTPSSMTGYGSSQLFSSTLPALLLTYARVFVLVDGITVKLTRKDAFGRVETKLISASTSQSFFSLAIIGRSPKLHHILPLFSSDSCYWHKQKAP